jgi:glutamyl/glutaminyl-tRNA synthetase
VPEEQAFAVRDGPPAELLAQVVDDHDAAVTLVLHEVGPPVDIARYMALCRDLGWTPPSLVQLPPISDDGLDPTTSIAALRQAGYAGRAVANWIARLGWSPRGRRKLYPLPELAQRFDMGRLARRPVRAGRGELGWFSRRHWEQTDVRQLAAMLAVRWQRAYGSADRATGTGLAPAAWRRALVRQVVDQARSLSDAVDATRFAFKDRVVIHPDAAAVLAQAFAPRVLCAFAEGILAIDPFTYERIDAFVSDLRWAYRDRLGVRSRDVMHVIRAALTGRIDGPCLVAACEVLGKGRSARRVRETVEQLRV